MHKFTHPLAAGDDAISGKPVFGFNLNGMFITDPKLSECGRFEVDPEETYGLTEQDVVALEKLNKALDAATMAALDAGCLEIQNALGVESGDFAGLYFSGDEAARPVREVLQQYLLAEVQAAD